MRPTALALALLLAAPAAAEEGMWLPSQVPSLAGRMAAIGFRGDPAALGDLTGDPMGAIVSLGGCSASFVSPEGLIATNHHCVVGSLQQNSTPGRNLLREGFLARARSEVPWSGPSNAVSRRQGGEHCRREKQSAWRFAEQISRVFRRNLCPGCA